MTEYSYLIKYEAFKLPDWSEEGLLWKPLEEFIKHEKTKYEG